jgi:hypothetical protein
MATGTYVGTYVALVFYGVPLKLVNQAVVLGVGSFAFSTLSLSSLLSRRKNPVAFGENPREEEAGAAQSPFYAAEQQFALVLSRSTPSFEDFSFLGHSSSSAAPVDPRSMGRSRTTAGGRRGGGYSDGSAGNPVA